MGLWACINATSPKINLLMVCLELGQNGLRTARAFGQQFKLPASVTNGYIEQKCELPSFGQLGCQGFVVLGLHGEFAMQRTVPCFLEAGQRAFTAVETLFPTLWNISFDIVTEPVVTITKPMALASVGDPALDIEHETLQRAVEELRTNGRPEVMQSLLALWQAHSDHEEQLFDEYDFGQHRTAKHGFAATKPHCEHHRFIASMMEEAIKCGSASTSRIEQIVSEIERHAEVYDAAYVGKLRMTG